MRFSVPDNEVRTKIHSEYFCFEKLEKISHKIIIESIHIHRGGQGRDGPPLKQF